MGCGCRYTGCCPYTGCVWNICGYMYCAEQQRGRMPKAAATRSTARKCFTTAPAERGENQVGEENQETRSRPLRTPLRRHGLKLERYFRISWIRRFRSTALPWYPGRSDRCGAGFGDVVRGASAVPAGVPLSGRLPVGYPDWPDWADSLFWRSVC